ncbi:MAG: CHASE2 domain-containing protein [Candidatus Methylacidiphilales bacterium]|nr:CHASE2 domain-containing protein [Candidatus Methylacidiphilales bacterium]
MNLAELYTPVLATLLRFRVQLGLAAAWLLIVTAGHWMGVLQDLDEGMLDWRIRMPSARPADTQLALIEINEIPPDRPWPWSRLEFTLLLDRESLLRYAPRSLVLEPVLAGPDPVPREDSRLAEKLHLYDRHVLAAALVREDAANSTTPTPAPANVAGIPTRGSLAAVPKFAGAFWPYEGIAESAAIGISNLRPQGEAVTRWLPMIFQFRDKVVPSLSLQAAAQQLGADLSKSTAVPGSVITLRDGEGKYLRSIPVDEEGRMRVRFHIGRPEGWRDTYGQFLVYQTSLGSDIRPPYELRLLRNRQVWVGRTDPAAIPVRTLAGDLPPVRLHMAGALNIIEGDFIRPLSTPMLFFLYALLMGAVIGAFYGLGMTQAMVLLAIAAVSWLELSIVLFRGWSLAMPMLGFVIFALGAALWCVVAAYGPMPLPPESRRSESRQLVAPRRFTPRRGVRPTRHA